MTMGEGTAKKYAKVPGTNQTYELSVMQVNDNAIMILVSYITDQISYKMCPTTTLHVDCKFWFQHALVCV